MTNDQGPRTNEVFDSCSLDIGRWSLVTSLDDRCRADTARL